MRGSQKNSQLPGSVRPIQSAVACCAVAWLVLVGPGCQRVPVNGLADLIEPSNYRDWSPQFSRLSYASWLPDGRLQISNVRNNSYLTENDFVLQYSDRTFPITDVRTVDFVVVPFRDAEFMAHTMLSFGLADGSYLSISSEIRTEKGEEYSPVKGLGRQYELTYVVADERDLIRLRTRHRDADVYLYRTTATAEQAQMLLLDMLQRVNELAVKPEFYNTITNNCTTNVLNHVNRLRQTKISYSWQVLLPGFSDEFAYELGMLDNRVPFEQLKQNALINELATRHYDDPDFSRLIRSRIVPVTTAAQPVVRQ